LTQDWYDVPYEPIDGAWYVEAAMTGEKQRYLSYLVRLWRTSSNGEQIWRASVESPGSGRRQGFSSLQELFSFLEAQANRAELDDEHDRAYDSHGTEKLGGDYL
jgi:hypothetical protein